MSGGWLETLARCVLGVVLILALAPLFEGVMRKVRATIHSRMGPPLTQPWLDLFKLLGKEDLRSATGLLYGATPALTLASVLLTGLLVPFGGTPPLGFAGDIVALLYLSTMSAVLVMWTGFASASPYASVGSSREMMLTFSVEPLLAVVLVVGALKAGTLSVGGIASWQAAHGPTLSMAIAGIALFLALQAQAGRLPFDIAEADQEIMGGPFIEQSGPRLALFKWALWCKQLVFSLLLVEVFVPWPHIGVFAVDLLLSVVKVMVVLLLVTVIEVVNPRLRIDQALSWFLRVGFFALAGLAFAVVGA